MKFKLKQRLLGASALFAMSTALFLPPSALAHDEVVSTVPADGDVVQAGVIDLRLTYSGELMEIAESAEIIVLDPSGELVNNGCATVQGTDLATKVDVDAVGIHTVNWRAVSGDGHPIEGSFSFEVENSTNHVSEGIVAGTDCDWAVSELSGMDDSDPDWQYLLLWLLLPFAGITLYFVLRPRPKPTS